MTGTSIDGLDAALVSIDGEGLDMTAKVVRTLSKPLGPCGADLQRMAQQRPLTSAQIAQTSAEFALLHAKTCRELAGKSKIDLVSVHGQTVYHHPPLSWQFLNAAPIAREMNAPVVFDLRAADLAAGGQGAPITPIADWVLFRKLNSYWAVVNLGGFCNVTFAPDGVKAKRKGSAAEQLKLIGGLDVCVCNQLLDQIAREVLKMPYDDGGAHALKGRCNDDALWDLSGVLSGQTRSGRSLGTGDELSDWVGRFRKKLSPKDLAATACEGIAQAIAQRIGDVDHILLAGGGAKNKALFKALDAACTGKVESTDDHGVPSSYREAVCMAVLGALCQDRVPITLQQVTNFQGTPPMSGSWVLP